MKAIKRMLYWKRKQLYADVFENEVNGLLQSFFVAFIFWKNTVIYICSGLSSLTLRRVVSFPSISKPKGLIFICLPIPVQLFFSRPHFNRYFSIFI